MRKKRTFKERYKKIQKNNEKRRKTDEEFQTKGIEDQDLNPEPPSNYQCLYCPEVWSSKAAFEFHMRLAHCKVDTFQLEDLPDEVLLNVLNFLELPDLNRCGQVSKKLKTVSLIQSLWQKIVLFNDTKPKKTVLSIDLVEKILERGCKTLCLKRCTLTGAAYSSLIFDTISNLDYLDFEEYEVMIESDKCQMKAEKNPYLSQLINLELYQCDLSKGFMETLLFSSHSLKRFSLTKYNFNILSDGVLSTFYSQNGQTLQTLNLVSSRVVNLEHIELIVKNCIRLKEVDLSCCCLSCEGISSLVNGITTAIEKFSLGFHSNVKDRHVKILVSRCKKITSLNLALSKNICDNSLTSIKENLSSTLEELDVGRCQKITDSKLLEMRSMPKLKVLNYFKPGTNDNYENLKKHLPQLTNNDPWKKWKDMAWKQPENYEWLLGFE